MLSDESSSSREWSDLDAAVSGDYTWLGVVIVIGSMVSLAYYLRVIAAMWMQAAEPAEAVPVATTGRPALAGGDEAADEATVKRFFREDARIRLQPENSALEPLYPEHVQILGKVIGVFRRL